LLPDVNQEGRSEDLPARICTNPECYQPLPTDVDDRKLITIAVVGMHGASKTHFLATSLYQAYHDRGLDLALECSEFYPDEPSSKSLYVNYFERLLETERVLPKTQLELMTDVRSHPLVCRATFGAGPPVALLFHDVAGEVFVDQGLRNQYTSFLRRADGIIFIIDPLRLRPIRKSSSQMFGVRPSQAEMSQTDLVRAVIDDLRGRDLSRLPVAVAVSKSDLLTAALGTHFMFAQDPPVERDAWMANIYDVDAEMRSLLAQRLDAADLVAATRPFRNVTFHAVAPLGMQPVVTIHAGMPSPPSSFSGGSLDGAAAIVDMPGVESQAEVKNIRPRRCLDPLVSILSRLPNLSV
jgi:hypothetical protein